MKILYDQQIFSFQNYGGISRYFYELIERVEKTNNEVLVDGKFSNNAYLPELEKDVSKVLPHVNFPHKNVFNFYINSLLDSQNLKAGNFDLLHATYYHPYFLKYLRGKPYVITVYDMTHELFKKESKGFVDKTIEYKGKTIQGASGIIAISDNTKKDIIKIYGVPENKIDVICLASSLRGIRPSTISSLPRKYILFVGNRSGYKNFELFAKAIAPIIKNETELYLVCAGGSYFSSKEAVLFEKLGIENRVKHIVFKSDNELAYIYKNAFVYVLPSLYEGFGMTALEAFSMGCPVVASSTSSIPEVCENAALYCDPQSPKSIRKAVENVLNVKKLRRELISKGYSQERKFSWDKTVKETLKVYEKVLKS